MKVGVGEPGVLRGLKKVLSLGGGGGGFCLWLLGYMRQGKVRTSVAGLEAAF